MTASPNPLAAIRQHGRAASGSSRWRILRPEKNALVLTPYQVAAGDTLSKIARKRYGDAAKWRVIASANPGLDLKKLKAGQIIQLPNVQPSETMEKRQ